MFDSEWVQFLAQGCDQATGEPLLDKLHANYNEGSPREDLPNYYRFLYRLGRHHPSTRLVELGCHYGAGLLHFCAGCLDPVKWDGGDMKFVATGIDVTQKIKPEIVAELFNTSFIHGSSIDNVIVNKFADESLDVVFIDTDHTYKTTAEEFRLWLPKAKPGGLILFDDIEAPEYADGCGRFFKELEGEKLSLPHLHPDNWGFGIWFKP